MIVNQFGGQLGAYGAIDLRTTDVVPDGQVLLVGDALLIGTGPLPVLEDAAREARRIVRAGMADVLAWCGLPLEPEPSGHEILARLLQETR